MNAQDPREQIEAQHRAQQLDQSIEAALFEVMSSYRGRSLVAWMVRGTHNLGHVYMPGMTFDAVAFEAGRQYDARELIRVVRRTERCSRLFDQALREYDHEWCSTRSDESSTGASGE